MEGVAGAGEPKKGLMRCLLSTGLTAAQQLERSRQTDLNEGLPYPQLPEPPTTRTSE